MAPLHALLEPGISDKGRNRRRARYSRPCNNGGVLILAATPIGNLGDASKRLIEALENASVIASEDTRTTIHLMRALGIENRPRLIALHEHNETERAAEIVELARSVDVLVLSDAGMPAISDPGFPLVAAAASAGVTVTALPGPSAVLTALAVSGLPTDRFSFEGFLPRKAGERRARLAELQADRRTTVLFEAPHRLSDALTDMAAVLGPERRAVVCRELTKTYEEVVRGTLPELVAWAAGGVRGEVTLVLEGAPAPTVDLTPTELVRQVGVREAAGLTRKEAIVAVASETGLPRRDVYDAVVALKSR